MLFEIVNLKWLDFLVLLADVRFFECLLENVLLEFELELLLFIIHTFSESAKLRKEILNFADWATLTTLLLFLITQLVLWNRYMLPLHLPLFLRLFNELVLLSNLVCIVLVHSFMGVSCKCDLILGQLYYII